MASLQGHRGREVKTIAAPASVPQNIHQVAGEGVTERVMDTCSD